MAQRETQKIKLPHSESEVEIYTWITAREALEVTQSETPNDYILEALVVSMDGSKENIVDRILDLRFEDYKVLDDAMAKILPSGDSSEKKT